MIVSPAVDEFIERQPPEITGLLLRMRYLLHDAIPLDQELVKWKVPFYMYCGHLCYLNPVKKGVAIGFYHGTKLADSPRLLTGDGKMVRHVVVRCGEEIPEEGIRELLLEAMILNEMLQESKRKR